MDKYKKIYFHKEDVWSSGPHWMSSASRDLYEHFYKAIRTSFLAKFKDEKIKEIIGKILYVRKYDADLFGVAYEMSKSKKIDLSLFNAYEEKSLPLPEEKEYDRNGEVLINEMDFDKVIYNDFEFFFYNADHGFSKTEDALLTVYELWIIFMKEFTIEDLENQLKEELAIVKKWEFYLKKYIKEYIDEKSTESWHQYLSKKMKDEEV